MAKPQSGKQQNKPVESTDSVAETQPSNDTTTAVASTVVASTPAASSTKKDAARSKKQSGPTKNGSLLPSAYKLEQLKAAVAAAGNIENLLLILNHVEEAGGKSEVTESIEAYRVLKTVLEE